MRASRLLIAVLLAVFGALAGAPASPAAVAGHFRLALESPAAILHPARTAEHNDFVVLQAWEGRRAAELKAMNPALEVLVYQNLGSMAQGVGAGGLSSSGVNFAEADAAYPGWFLLEADGNRIPEQRWSWLWMADVGEPGYQQRWTANVLNLLRSGPWDGVMMDDTNTTTRFHVANPAVIAKYPTDAAYQQAVGSMLAYAGPRIIAAGKLAIPNFGSWVEYPGVVASWLRYVSGGMDENFVKWAPALGDGYGDLNYWLTQLREVQTAERMGKTFLAVTRAAPSDRGALRYGWATALLGAAGHTYYYAAGARFEETWSPSYEVPLGPPRSPALAAADGSWRRRFARGLVVVNPTPATLRVWLHGTYSGSGLRRARVATMAPHSGLVLTRVRRLSR